jgi:hypothetical protein
VRWWAARAEGVLFGWRGDELEGATRRSQAPSFAPNMLYLPQFFVHSRRNRHPDSAMHDR